MESTQLDAILTQLQRNNELVNEQNKLLRNQHKRDRKREQQQQRSKPVNKDKGWTNLAIEFGVYLVAIALLTVYGEYKAAINGEDTLVDRVLGTDFNTPLKAGDRIDKELEITSGFGMRMHPILGVPKMHDGVDINTPIGRTVYFPFRSGKVECLNDAGGYGLYAIATPVTPENRVGSILLGHLSKCGAGSYVFGQTIAATGNSGGSTAPHLHFQQQDVNGSPVQPTKGWVYQTVFGNRVLDSSYAAQSGLAGVDDLVNRIVRQESAGDHTATNVDSGAMGLGQVMPENLGSKPGEGWDFEILGKDITQADFLSDPNLQTQIINGKIAQYQRTAAAKGESPYEQCRSVAAAWYSGQMGLKDSTALQGGGKYPSIRDYTLQVCDGYGSK